MRVFKTKQQIIDGIHGTVLVLPEEHEVHLMNLERLWIDDVIDDLIRTAVFAPEAEVKKYARWIIHEVGQQVGVYPASIQTLYDAMGAEKVSNFTVPAINLRGPTYDMARAAIRAKRRLNAGPVIFELAKSEMGYTNQSPAEYSACIIAAAIKEMEGKISYGPVFIQGDHFQVNASAYNENAGNEVQKIKSLIDDAIEAGFYNIDIDTSTLVDLSKSGTAAQQELNYTVSAELIEYVRQKSPKGVTISVGGEIGEVGSQNSTPEELRAYMNGLQNLLAENDLLGPSKISVQTGTSHGGVPAADGSVKEVNLDFETLEALSKIAREEYGMGGAVQHGASTLPDELFDKFPEVGTAEIHLATGFQNLILDHKKFPKKLREEMYEHLRAHHAEEKKSEWTDEQFIYKLRKKVHGPFKRQLWDLNSDVKWAIMEDLDAKFEYLFLQLGIENTTDVIDDYFEKIETGIR